MAAESPAARGHRPLRRHRLRRRRGPPQRAEPGLPEGRPPLLLRRRQRGREDERRGWREVFNKPVWKDGKLAGEGYFVNHIPPVAIERAGGWEALVQRGERQFTVNCAVCHGAAGCVAAAGRSPLESSGAYGLSVAPSNLVSPEAQAQARRPDLQHDHQRRPHNARVRSPGEGPGPLGDCGVFAGAAIRGGQSK